MFRFENTEYLWGLLAIPVFFLIFLIVRSIRKKKLNEFGDPSLISQLMPDISSFKPHLKFWLMMFALASGILAIANPQIGTKIEEIKREGVEVIIAIDVSNSMKAEDIKPSRLERAKNSVIRLIDKLANDRIGLIIFAGDSFLQLPLTTDYSAAKMLVSAVDPEMVQTQGTALGSAIELATESFSDDENRNKAIIIFTDGENHEDDALGAAKDASDKGIVVHTIGMGSQEGSPIPIYKNGRRAGFVQDRDGNTVISKLNSGMLQQVSSVADGTFFLASNGDPDLEGLIKDLSELDKKEFESAIATDYEDRFQYMIALGLFFLIVEALVSYRKNKYLSALNDFAGGKT